ncbi:PREDICTED: protein LONGIFOLIA 2-like isoform X2 [Lupinus angustifolius]|uniref:protein LONGIFOLIA 2-like isoform X2 n=1 Tax=Lupinus angustifolius TaxID=3871 RepID=UPI00092E3103|nr:PREDICTED: protein LONGIFOLIA 2-like isoform X2 [Lupinus angustifolius]
MAAKFLHSSADDNTDLQKQIGCMTGIFQLFDRHHIVTPLLISHKRLSPGNSHFNHDNLERESNGVRHRQKGPDISLNKGVSEKQRVSTESSRVSFSSSGSSSMSSLDFKAQVDAHYDQINFHEPPMRDTIMNQRSTSPHFGRQSLDFRDVVKDSMYRETRGLSLRTTAKEEAAICVMKHMDSPRPLQLYKSDGYDRVGIDGKESAHIDVKDSLRVLAKLREVPWHYGEAIEPSRLSSYEVKDGGNWYSISKDAPRFSYDGRGTSRLSFETRETIKCQPKLPELPRLSLDSRQGSWRRSTYNPDSKKQSCLRNFNTGNSTSDESLSSLQHSSATQSRPPSVVAKLMGLEALPESYLANETRSNLSESGSTRGNIQFSRPSKDGFIRPLQISNSPKSSLKDRSSPRRKSPDAVVKPISGSRFPIEPAPWKQQDGNRSSKKPNSKALKAPAKTPDSFPSVYSEIEKRLKDLEFKQSGRDLRALKQILEAMQVKGLLETRKEEQASNIVGSQRDYEPKPLSLVQNSSSTKQQNSHGNNLVFNSIRGSDSARTFESPIVIMKPAKLIEKTGTSASSVIPVVGLSDHRLQSGCGVHADNKKGTASGRIAKDQSPKNTRRDASTSSIAKKASSSSKTTKSTQSQPRSQQFPGSVKNSGSVSPRMQQKKLELEKRLRPPTPPSDSNKPGRQHGKQATESVSRGRKLRHKVHNTQHIDDQLSEISNESRSLSCQEDQMSQKSDGIAVDLNIDMEVTSSFRSARIIVNQSPSLKASEQLVSGSMHKKSTLRLDEDESIAELATDGPDHRSPVSVLDGSEYTDDVPSPVKRIPNAPKAGNAEESQETNNKDRWNPANSFSFDSTGTGEINCKKLQSIDHLVQKLRRLNSSHDESRIDYIASLCENSNPDHRYISEILLASGLLLRDLSSELLTFQNHSSTHPINPELFLVLEQTKASSLLSKEETCPGKVAYAKLNSEKFHRRLIFDAVNEILGTKLGSCPEPWLKSNGLSKKTLNAQKLLKELCFEIEKMQAKKQEMSIEDEGDGLKSMLWENVMHGSESWTNLYSEIPLVVLDVERLIFKDLVDEIVIGEAGNLRIKSSSRRKLFGN